MEQPTVKSVNWKNYLKRTDILDFDAVIIQSPIVKRRFVDTYTDTFQKPEVEWAMRDTYIQDKGINQDFGLF